MTECAGALTGATIEQGLIWTTTRVCLNLADAATLAELKALLHHELGYRMSTGNVWTLSDQAAYEALVLDAEQAVLRQRPGWQFWSQELPNGWRVPTGLGIMLLLEWRGYPAAAWVAAGYPRLTLVFDRSHDAAPFYLPYYYAESRIITEPPAVGAGGGATTPAPSPESEATPTELPPLPATPPPVLPDAPATTSANASRAPFWALGFAAVGLAAAWLILRK